MAAEHAWGRGFVRGQTGIDEMALSQPRSLEFLESSGPERSGTISCLCFGG
jgi:hypothetical protein